MNGVICSSQDTSCTKSQTSIYAISDGEKRCRSLRPLRCEHCHSHVQIKLRNEMSTKGPKSLWKTPKYSTLTPKKVSDSTETPKKVTSDFWSKGAHEAVVCQELALPHFPCSAIVLIHQETNAERL